jgi:hypothetical protein
VWSVLPFFAASGWESAAGRLFGAEDEVGMVRGLGVASSGRTGTLAVEVCGGRLKA